jgi:hypothetical protein
MEYTGCCGGKLPVVVASSRGLHSSVFAAHVARWGCSVAWFKVPRRIINTGGEQEVKIRPSQLRCMGGSRLAV